EALPSLARRPDAMPVATRQYADDQPMGPVAVYVCLRRAGGLALAGLLRDLARNRRVAPAGSEVKGKGQRKKKENTESVDLFPFLPFPFTFLLGRDPWRIFCKSARAAVVCPFWTCFAVTRASPR